MTTKQATRGLPAPVPIPPDQPGTETPPGTTPTDAGRVAIPGTGAAPAPVPSTNFTAPLFGTLGAYRSLDEAAKHVATQVPTGRVLVVDDRSPLAALRAYRAWRTCLDDVKTRVEKTREHGAGRELPAVAVASIVEGVVQKAAGWLASVSPRWAFADAQVKTESAALAVAVAGHLAATGTRQVSLISACLRSAHDGSALATDLAELARLERLCAAPMDDDGEKSAETTKQSLQAEIGALRGAIAISDGAALLLAGASLARDLAAGATVVETSVYVASAETYEHGWIRGHRDEVGGFTGSYAVTSADGTVFAAGLLMGSSSAGS